MDKIITSLQNKKKLPDRLTKNSRLYKTIIDAIKDKKGESIVSLDLKKIDEAVADYFILCDARSNIQVKAIAGFIEQQVEENCGERPYRTEHGEQWTLVDYVNVVVHVFQHDQRIFYDLEHLWEDAPKTEY